MHITRAQRARLGLFLLAIAGLVTATVLLLVGQQHWHEPVLYRTRFHESVSGLEKNSAVRYQGLRIGTVSSMGVAEDDPSAIEVALSIDASVPLFAGTLAQLDMSGLTGLKAINLTAGDPRKARLTPGTLIAESPSGLGHLADNASAVIANVRVIAEQLGKFVNQDNRHRVEHLIGGVDTLVGHINHFMDKEEESLGAAVREISQTAHKMGRTADAATSFLQEGQRIVQRLEKDTQETLAALREPLRGLDADQVRQTLRSLHDAGHMLAKRLSDKEAGGAIAAIGDTAERINHLVQDVDLAVRAGREDFAKSLSYLRQAAEDLREFSRLLAQNPSVLVRGRNDGE